MLKIIRNILGVIGIILKIIGWFVKVSESSMFFQKIFTPKYDYIIKA